MLPFYFLRPFKVWIPILSSWLFSCFAAVGITLFIWIQFFSMHASLELVYIVPRIEFLIEGQPCGRTAIPAALVDKILAMHPAPSVTNCLNAMPQNVNLATTQDHFQALCDEHDRALYYYPLQHPDAGPETRFHVITNKCKKRMRVTYPRSDSEDDASVGSHLIAQEMLQLRLEVWNRGSPPDDATSITVAMPFPLGDYRFATLWSYFYTVLSSLVKLLMSILNWVCRPRFLRRLTVGGAEGEVRGSDM